LVCVYAGEIVKTFDVIVVGLGAVGSATAYSLSKRGHRVMGIDQFSPPHSYGSSHGETRIIRKSYFEHPSYVPLLCRAYELWATLEQEVGEKLYHATGLLEIGPENGIVIPGVRKSASTFGLPIEEMSMNDAIRNFPMIEGDREWSVIFERDAGYLRVESCIRAHLNQAETHGAKLVTHDRVLEWRPLGVGVVVRTASEEYSASRLILTTGPWANDWLSREGVPLTIVHKHLYWHDAPRAYREESGFPCFFFETPAGHFYGFPVRDSLGLKVARHSGGQVATGSIDGTHPDDIEDQTMVETFLRQHLPTVATRCSRAMGCYYTMTPDENFIVDTLPGFPQVAMVAGLSGHGFKFASVLGECVGSLATGEPLGLDIEFLKLGRFG
jgi:sarcosine oxidase